jgi:hypothetical protein
MHQCTCQRSRMNGHGCFMLDIDACEASGSKPRSQKGVGRSSGPIRTGSFPYEKTMLLVALLGLSVSVLGESQCYAAHRTTPAAKPTPTPSSPRVSNDGSCLGAHNSVRQQAGLPSITWDNSLQHSAQGWANYLASSNSFFHSNSGVGENLSLGIGYCQGAVGQWMGERKAYHGQVIGNGNFHDYGHFSQIMHPELRRVGCAVSENIVVCHYYPPQERGSHLDRF